MFESLKPLVSLFAQLLKTRFELAAIDLEEERLRLAELLVLAVISLFLWGIGIILACLWVLEWAGLEHRVQALGGLAAAFALAASSMSWRWRQRAASKPRLLGATLAEFSRDLEVLRHVRRTGGHHE